MLIVKNRLPNAARVGSFPNTAAGGAHVIDRGISGDSGNSRNTTRAVWSDQTPAHGGVQARIDCRRSFLLGMQGYAHGGGNKESSGKVGDASQIALQMIEECITARPYN